MADTEPKRGTKVTVGLIAAFVLGALLVIAFGISLVALVPLLLLLVVAGGLYVAWRHYAVRRGLERDARGGYVELVGGREAEEPSVSRNRATTHSHS